MSPTTQLVILACGLLVVTVIYLRTSRLRHRLDNVLSNGFVPPERRWTYDQRDMIAFVEPALRQPMPGTGGTALAFYAGPILSWDICFALTFAALIATFGVFATDWLAFSPWLARAAAICACMSLVYGVADVAEDLTLRKIFRHAETLEIKKKARKRFTEVHPAADVPSDAAQRALKEAALQNAAPADAAQTDAANVLTRLKMVTLGATLVGAIIFLFFMALDQIRANADAPAPQPVAL
jgi:hypothetical protein